MGYHLLSCIGIDAKRRLGFGGEEPIVWADITEESVRLILKVRLYRASGLQECHLPC